MPRPCAWPPAGNHSLPGGRPALNGSRRDSGAAGGAVAPLTDSHETRYKTAMRRGRSTLLRWGALFALALLALATTPHFHDDGAEARDDTCVLCHVQGSPPIASSVHENPDPAAGGSPHAPVQGHARAAEIAGHASRAPPA